jgi:hypothetical protein
MQGGLKKRSINIGSKNKDMKKNRLRCIGIVLSSDIAGIKD